MEYFIIISITVVLLYILYIWYRTRYLNHVPDTSTLELHTESDKLLTHWYSMNLGTTHFPIINDLDLASKFLKQLYDIEPNTSYLVIGHKFDKSLYKTHTGHNIQTIYNGMKPIMNTDVIYDIRSTLGLPGEIAIIHDRELVRMLRRKTPSIDGSMLDAVLDSNLWSGARDFLQSVLQARWNKIKSIYGNTTQIRETGSYAYVDDKIHVVQDISNEAQVIELFGSVLSLGGRINLLCSDYEFEACIVRWKRVIAQQIMMWTGERSA